MLATAGAAATAYVVAFEAIGRTEKALAGAVVTGLAALIAALIAALDLDYGIPGVALFVTLAVAAELGLVPALPSTSGSAARTVPGEVLAASSQRA